MSEFLRLIQVIWMDYLRHFIDIILSAFIIYKLMDLTSGTRSMQVLRGILFLLIATLVASMLDFVLIGWLLRWFWVAGVVALVIVFQPEIRSFLADLGSRKFTRLIMRGDSGFIDEVISSLKNISSKGQGALVVFEQETGLRDFVESGIMINGEISQENIETMYTPFMHLHHGAVIISQNRILGAGCILPLTHNPMMSRVMGTRHRAAVGLSEVSDAIICVVSEETGEFSIAHEGKLKQGVDIEEIKKYLLKYFSEKPTVKGLNLRI